MKLIVENLSFNYQAQKPILDRVSFELSQTEIVGIQAPSGYGKSTFAKILSGFLTPGSGKIFIAREEKEETTKTVSNHCFPVQLIFQHPEQAINPRWQMSRVLKETGGELTVEMQEQLGLKEEWLTRFPNELSGGELQSFAIARTLMARPQFIIADEISTMFDAVKQAKIWQFMIQQCQQEKIGMLVMSHKRSLLKQVCTSVVDLPAMNQC